MARTLAQVELRRRDRLEQRKQWRDFTQMLALIVPVSLAAWLTFQLYNPAGHHSIASSLTFATATYTLALLAGLATMFGLQRIRDYRLMALRMLLGGLLAAIFFAPPLVGSLALVSALAQILHNPSDAGTDTMLGLVTYIGVVAPPLFIGQRILFRRQRAYARRHPMIAGLALQGLVWNERHQLDPLATGKAEDTPRCLAVSHSGTYTAYLRDDVPAAIRRRLLDLPASTLYEDEAQVRQAFADDVPCAHVERRRTYTFPEEMNSVETGATLMLRSTEKSRLQQCGTKAETSRRATFAVVEDGRVASYCRATQPGLASEAVTLAACVFTQPDYRHRGYAAWVTRAWAAYHQRHGALLFFSHVADDVASAALSRHLGLIPCFDQVAYF